jgi:hypothetical protein
MCSTWPTTRRPTEATCEPRLSLKQNIKVLPNGMAVQSRDLKSRSKKFGFMSNDLVWSSVEA